jgi:hypothetical protein
MRARTRFSQLLNLRVFQQYRRKADLAEPALDSRKWEAGPLKREAGFPAEFASLDSSTPRLPHKSWLPLGRGASPMKTDEQIT